MICRRNEALSSTFCQGSIEIKGSKHCYLNGRIRAACQAQPKTPVVSKPRNHWWFIGGFLDKQIKPDCLIICWNRQSKAVHPNGLPAKYPKIYGVQAANRHASSGLPLVPLSSCVLGDGACCWATLLGMSRHVGILIPCYPGNCSVATPQLAVASK